MPYITSAERIGYERGRQEGRQEERRSLLLLLLTQKLGQLSPSLSDRITALSLEQLEGLAVALLSFNSVDDLTHWLDQ